MATYHAVAGQQRAIGEASMATWPPPQPPATVNAELFTLSCERDRLLLTRMLSSFLSYVGRPRSFVVVSDGSITASTRRHLMRLDPSITVQHWRDCFDSRTPDSVARFAARDPMGKKLATMCAMTRVSGLARGYVDSDIEFFRGASHLRELLDRMSEESAGVPCYQLDSDCNYDASVVGSRAPAPRINAGLVFTMMDLDWEAATAHLDLAAGPSFNWTEQTIVAIALTLAEAEALPPELYRMTWSDRRLPWDAESRKDIVCRHYASWMLQWKMLMRGGPRGYATLPRAIAATAASALRRSP